MRWGAWLEDFTDGEQRIRENVTSLNRVMIRRPTIEGYLGHTDKCLFKNWEALNKWGKLVSLESSYPEVERGWLQSKATKATNKKDTPRSWAHSGTGAITENQEGGIQE